MLAAWAEEGRIVAIQPKQGGAGRKVVRYKMAPIFAGK
jgi:hypothetical protein